jgi:lipoprotein-anchoring transpeptidase ErfK/SrfK
MFSRTARDIFGSLHRDIPLQVSHSNGPVLDLATRIDASLNRSAQNATVEATPAGLVSVPSEPGVIVEDGRLRSQLERALTVAAASHVVEVPVRRVRPSVTLAQLPAQYPAYIMIDRENFTLRFYQHLKLANTYPIAVGMQGLETTAGLYHVQWKQVDPPWYVPNSAWAGALAGKVIPPGPEDPLKARFMGFNGGAGIHGIDPSEYETIGHDASHGCVRMRIPDVISLYSRAPVGTPVYVL